MRAGLLTSGCASLVGLTSMLNAPFAFGDDGTALIMGFAGTPDPSQSYINEVTSLFISPTPNFPGQPTFSGYNPIAQVTTEESHALGTRIFQYGDPGDKLYILLDGKVRISRDVPGMGEEALAVLGPGAVFGEMALLSAQPRSASVACGTILRMMKAAAGGLMIGKSDAKISKTVFVSS